MEAAMNDIGDLQFHVGPFGNKRWLALTLQSPYLCFEAESKDALLEKTKRAVAFCRKVHLDIKQDRGRETTPFLATEIVSGRELEDA
jgi:hypothetical protein